MNIKLKKSYAGRGANIFLEKDGTFKHITEQSGKILDDHEYAISDEDIKRIVILTLASGETVTLINEE